MDREPSSGGRNPSPLSDQTPPDVYEVRITGPAETIAKVLREVDLDIGCRHPHIESNPDGSATLLAYGTDERIRELIAAGYRVERGENVSDLGRQRQAEVGRGDRFEGGRRAPTGLGEKGDQGNRGGTAS